MTQEQPEAGPDLAGDMQEALSIRYVTGVRLALLSSGRVALFSGGPQGLSQVELFNLEPGLPPVLVTALSLDLADRDKPRPASSTGSTVAQVSLEEMGL